MSDVTGEEERIIAPVDAERALLSAVLSDEDRRAMAYEAAAVFVDASSFGTPAHARVWRTMGEIIARGMAPDGATVADALKSSGERDAARIVGELAMTLASPSLAEQYAQRVAEHAFKRSVGAAIRAAHARLMAEGDPLEVANAALAELAAVPREPRRKRDLSLHAHIERWTDSMIALADRAAAGNVVCARWGVDVLDGYTNTRGERVDGVVGGLFNGEVYFISGVPAAGKTLLATCAALATAEMRIGRVLPFSLEMNGHRMVTRLAAHRTGIPEARIKSAHLNANEMNEMFSSMRDAATLPMDIIDDVYSMDGIRAYVKATQVREPVALVVIDFLQIAQIEGRFDSDAKRDAARAYAAQRIAKECDVPVIVVSSLTKNGQKSAREGKGGMEDMSGSGAEYAADYVGILRLEKPEEEGRPAPVVRVVLDTKKNRGGACYPVTLICDRSRGTFVGVAEEREGAMPDSRFDNVPPFDEDV